VAETSSSDDEPVVIKKYANRRLYNTATSSYVTLDHLCRMVKDGVDFVVYDAKTGEDITRPVLTQIIFEEEGKGQNLLPVSFLRQLIRFYGDSLQALVPDYLELSMNSFARNQDQMRRYIAEAFGEMNPFKPFEEMGRQNVAMLREAMSLFNPFAAAGRSDGSKDGSKDGSTGEPGEDSHRDDLTDLKRQLAEMQSRLDELAAKKG